MGQVAKTKLGGFYRNACSYRKACFAGRSAICQLPDSMKGLPQPSPVLPCAWDGVNCKRTSAEEQGGGEC
jgi:hypothetical protein